MRAGPERSDAFITFGAMAAPMAHQLADYNFDDELVEMIQRAHDAIVYLRIHGLLTEAEGRKAEKRVVKWIDGEYRAARSRKATP